MSKSFCMLSIVAVLFVAPGCTPDTDMYGLDGAAGAAGSAGEAGSGGSGGSGDECTPDGMERDCECPDGSDGTQTCEDGEWGECDCPEDKDGDGYPEDVDCDDDDPDKNPGATEHCDGKDNDCDGKVDEGCPDSESCNNGKDDDGDGLVDCDDPDCANAANCGGDEYTHYRDADGDGYTNGEYIKDNNPNAPAGYTNSPKPGIDCDDNNPNVHPGASEVCGNGIDDNCNNSIDEGCVTSEICNNGKDDDGDGLVDCDDPECANAANCGGDEYTHWKDSDGDGYTDGENFTDSNPNAPAGYTNSPKQGIDCDDNNPNVHPGASEVCGNGIDDDCDGQTDEGCTTSEVCNNGVDDDGDGLVDCADPDCANASNCQQADEVCDNGKDDDGDGLVDCDDPECANASNCQQAGTVTLKFQVDCSAHSWVQNVQPEGSWAGRNYGALSGCVVSGTRSATCTFDIPAPDFPTFVGQGDIGFGRYSGDASGNAPAPCYTPSEVEAMQGHAITLLCTHRLWKDGVPVEQVWESNGVIKPDGTQSCSDSGPFPYYNSRPLAQTAMQGELTEPLTESQMIGARFEVIGKVFYWMGGESLASGWRSLETLEPNDIIWLGSENPHVRMYFPSLFSVE